MEPNFLTFFIQNTSMAGKKRWAKQEEELLRELKSAHPGETWDTIAELYNSRIGNKSRLRTEVALSMKFKKMQFLKKQSAKKSLRKNTRDAVPQNEKHQLQSWTTPSPFLFETPIGSVEYEISLLQVSAKCLNLDRNSDRSISGISGQ